MASSSDPQAVRGFVPPQNDDEKRLMRRVEELCQTAQSRGIPRYTGFLSDREQALATAAMNRVGCCCGRFWGGWAQAERRVLCLEPPDAWQQEPIAVLHLQVPGAVGDGAPAHRDYLGSLLGLGLERACIGDLLLQQGDPAAYVFVLEDKAEFIAMNLTSAGRFPLHIERCESAPPELLKPQPRVLSEATVPSLRADTVLAAMMHTSRTLAAQAITAGRVEVNHIPLRAGHEPVYAQDVFTVRGSGRYRLEAIGGKSKKDRIFISFYQY